jgi:hypothetical protein
VNAYAFLQRTRTRLGGKVRALQSTVWEVREAMSQKRNGTRPKKREARSDPAVSYDEFKEFEGRRYTGMKIGRGHKWYYDRGEWKETKITPDLWQISYAVNKRRAGKAPEGSGVPVGAEYHWYVLAHQNVTKLNANDYTTTMAGVKFKVAHKRADTQKWSATPKAQRKRMIQFLRGVIEDLERQQEEEAGAARVRPEAGEAPAESEDVAPPRKRRHGCPDSREPEARPPKPSKRTHKKEPAEPRSMRKPPRRRRKASA